MKKLLFVTALAFVVFLSSCTDENEAGSNIVSSLDIDSEATLESNYEDVDLITEASLATVETGARVDRDAILECAILDHDRENKTIVIDYGDGCQGPGGRVRAGIIRISYSDHRLIPGASRIATFEGFSLDGVTMEGTRTVLNISESLADDPMFSITLTGGKLTFEDETIATRESQRTRTWLRAQNPLNDEATVEGNANGVKRDGTTYSVEVISELIYKRACWSSKVFIPVAGVKQYMSGENVAIVDYGDGSCDNEVTITVNDQNPVTKVITPSGRR